MQRRVLASTVILTVLSGDPTEWSTLDTLGFFRNPLAVCTSLIFKGLSSMVKDKSGDRK